MTHQPHGDEPLDDNADDYIDIEEPVTVCPHCQGTSAEYKGEAYDDEEYLGSAYRCDECGQTFYDIWKYGDSLD